nr:MAG TPA_asm: hypothetical protein [Bacteriophage sp.]
MHNAPCNCVIRILMCTYDLRKLLCISRKNNL